MSASMPWVKLYTETAHNHQLGRLPRELRWTWACLEMLAGECDAEGYLVTDGGPLSLDDIAYRLHETPKYMEKAAASLGNVGLLEKTDAGWLVTGFSDRQGRKQSEKRDQWRQSKAKIRQKNSGPEWSPALETSTFQEMSNRTPNGTVEVSYWSPTPRGEKRREEEEKKEIGADAPAPPDPKEKLIISHPILQEQLARYYQSKGRSVPRHYQSDQQRQAFDVVLSELGGKVGGLIEKGLARERSSLPNLLSWLQTCAKNERQPSSSFGTSAPPVRTYDPTLTPEELALKAQFKAHREALAHADR